MNSKLSQLDTFFLPVHMKITPCPNTFQKGTWEVVAILSKPQLNHNSIQPQPNITFVGLDLKMTLHTHHPQKLNVSNISAATDLILISMKL